MLRLAIKLGIVIALVLFFTGCGFTGGLGDAQAGGDVGEVTAETVNLINQNGLPWWQWVIIGMFIPSPWEILGLIKRSVIG